LYNVLLLLVVYACFSSFWICSSAKGGKHEKEGWPNSAYSVSKVAVSALSFIQQRAFDADPREDLVVNAVHPGYVDTDMTSHRGSLTIEQGNHNGRNAYANHTFPLHAQRTCLRTFE
jgi:NAD(P)-dependent dehydrogenase (short-subunit alcohol dehydrogenase family)